MCCRHSRNHECLIVDSIKTATVACKGSAELLLLPRDRLGSMATEGRQDDPPDLSQFSQKNQPVFGSTEGDRGTEYAQVLMLSHTLRSLSFSRLG